MTNMIEAVDQYNNGLEKIIPNLQKENFLKFFKVYSDELQLLEDSIQDVLLKTKISTAQGVNLDSLAQILDVQRDGKGDELYRTAIRNAVFEKSKHGGINDLISVCRIQIPQAITVTLDEYYPNTGLIFIEVADPATITNGELFRAALDNAKEAQMEIDAIAIQSDDYFLFSDLTTTTPASRGFATLSDPTGGILGGLIK